MPVSIVYDSDPSDAKVQGYSVPIEIYNALTIFAYQDLYGSLSAGSTRNLSVGIPQGDGRALVQRILQSDKSLTSQLQRIQAQLLHLVLASPNDWTRFYEEWEEIKSLFDDLPDNQGKYHFGPPVQVHML